MAKSKDIQELSYVNIKEYNELLYHVMTTGDRLLVLGNPGIGKSQCVHEQAKKLDKEVCDIRLSQFLDGGDLVMKIPNADNTIINEIVFNRLPTKSNQILFIDEFSHADETVKKAMFELIHDRKLGPYRLPDGVPIIAAGNEGRDMMSSDISSPLLDRFTFRVKLEPTLEEFNNYIKDKPNGMLIAGYLSAFKENMYVWPEHGRVLMTPRRWEKVSIYYTNQVLIKSIMPPGIYTGFEEFCKKVEMFRDVEAYINGKKKCPEDKGDQWAIYTACLSLLQNQQPNKFEDMAFNILNEKFVDMDAEIQTAVVFDTLRTMKAKKGNSDSFAIDLIAKLSEPKKSIFKKVITRYQFAVEGLQAQN